MRERDRMGKKESIYNINISYKILERIGDVI